MGRLARIPVTWPLALFDGLIAGEVGLAELVAGDVVGVRGTAAGATGTFVGAACTGAGAAGTEVGVAGPEVGAAGTAVRAGFAGTAMNDALLEVAVGGSVATGGGVADA